MMATDENELQYAAVNLDEKLVKDNCILYFCRCIHCITIKITQLLMFANTFSISLLRVLPC